MHIENENLNSFKPSYPLETIAPPEGSLFLDIETTGLSAQNCQIYLIGVAYHAANHWHIRQWFAENADEEADIIRAFFDFAQRFNHLIHFNGNTFDLPFIKKRGMAQGVAASFEHFTGLDIYRRITPYRRLLGLKDCKQKSVEAFLGIERVDTLSGGDLIALYHSYATKPTPQARTALLLHNSCDLMGMLEMLPVLAYHDLFNGEIRARKVQANYYSDIHGAAKNMLYMKLALPSMLPRRLSFNSMGCYFKDEGEEAYLAVPIYEEEMKYFYAAYKDYYYLPAEDVALHKSIAAYVDKAYRKAATPATCYTKKSATFLPQWELLVEPFFKREHGSKDIFFELTDERKKDRAFFATYSSHILNAMLAHF